MSKRFFAVLRYSAVVALVASAFVFSGCGDDDDGPTVFGGTIYDFIKSDQFKQSVNNDATKSFDSLVMYIDKFPTLAGFLKGSAEFTLFAPSNSAFISLTALPGLKDPDLINQQIIEGVLAYHFVQGKKMQADLAAGASITTIFANTAAGSTTFEPIVVNSDGTLKTGSQNQSIQVTAYDQLASNGVVHTTATVLIPPSVGGQLSSILGSIAATVLLGKDFTYLAYYIALNDAAKQPADKFSTLLATGEGITFLAIPNAVFEGFTKTVLAKATVTDIEIKTAIAEHLGEHSTMILENHLLGEQYTVAASSSEDIEQFSDGLVTAYSGKTLQVATGVPAGTCMCPTGVVIAGANTGGGTSNAPIMKADIDTEASIGNGILQVVGGIILP